jgi:hypothetical protein
MLGGPCRAWQGWGMFSPVEQNQALIGQASRLHEPNVRRTKSPGRVSGHLTPKPADDTLHPLTDYSRSFAAAGG